jgi:hypothetical protein
MRESLCVKRLDPGHPRSADFSWRFLSYQVPDRPCECVWTLAIKWPFGRNIKLLADDIAGLFAKL